MTAPRTYRMGVFHNGGAWSAYARDYSSEWKGFVGVFEVEATSWSRAVKAAIAKAKDAGAAR